MSYEEKIKIYQSMIRNLEKELKHYEGTPYFEDEEFKIREKINMHKEELRLYPQAAKADEYEAKAKAFDAIMREWEDEKLTKSHILETIQKYYDEYESGELDE